MRVGYCAVIMAELDGSMKEQESSKLLLFQWSAYGVRLPELHNKVNVVEIFGGGKDTVRNEFHG